MTKRFSFKKDERIRKNKEFERIFLKGDRLQDQYLKLILLKNEFGYSRIAIIVKRKYGKAYLRNKIKRRIREIFRLNKDKFPASTDIVIIPKKRAQELNYWQLKDNLLSLIKNYNVDEA